MSGHELQTHIYTLSWQACWTMTVSSGVAGDEQKLLAAMDVQTPFFYMAGLDPPTAGVLS